jgi:hypothetical protein
MKQILKLKTFKTICNHDVGKNFNYNSRFIFQNINNVLFNRPLSLKVWLWNEKDETKMYLNVSHTLLNNNMNKIISRFSRPWYDT